MISIFIDIKSCSFFLVYLPFSQTELSFRQALHNVVIINGPDDDSHKYIVILFLKSLDEYAKRVEKEMPLKFTKENY